jgi:hypothetical protein
MTQTAPITFATRFRGFLPVVVGPIAWRLATAAPA